MIATVRRARIAHGLVLTGSVPMWGRIGDSPDHKPVFISGVLISATVPPKRRGTATGLLVTFRFSGQGPGVAFGDRSLLRFQRTRRQPANEVPLREDEQKQHRDRREERSGGHLIPVDIEGGNELRQSH